MQHAVRVLRFKGVLITEEEEEGLYVAILLHDIGHGPFSHAMEDSIAESIDHETLSLWFIEALNCEFDGQLDCGLKIFRGSYSRPFLNQLICGQLDMDRLDYLKRDSFYTGVAEGNVNSQRLITMLNVVDDCLVVEEKGIYSIEKFLLARRLMYWQVYFHKTSLAAEHLLIRALQRARDLTDQGMEVPASEALSFFLKRPSLQQPFDPKTLDLFSQLDDSDVLWSLKAWRSHPDGILKKLSTMLMNRDLPRIALNKEPMTQHQVEALQRAYCQKHRCSLEEAAYFVFSGSVENQAYNQNKQNINILFKNRTIVDVVKASDEFNLEALSKPVKKYFICRPK